MQSPEHRPKVDLARKATVDLLDGVIQGHKMLSELILDGKFTALAPPVRARAQRLATVSLRMLPRADVFLRPHISKAPPDRVMNAMRLAVVESAMLDAPIHAVINDMVNLVGANGRTRPYKGLVNAILRKAIPPAQEKWDKSPVPMMPKWLRKPLIQAWDNRVIMGVELAHMKGAPVDITVKNDPAGWAERLGAQVLTTGSLRLPADIGQISNLPGYESGDWWVQDAAAALPALLLAPQKGARVLDLCAAPGGKTLQLAAMGADVTALDNASERLKRVHENLDRTGLSAKVVTADAATYKDDPFDAVLLDAPCSATGTIRRHPDLPYVKDGSGLEDLFKLQATMLDNAAKLVRPGGRLVYCTCSLLPQEGERQAQSFLARHQDFTPDRTLPQGVDPAWQSDEGGLRLRPDYWGDQGGMDGFYIIVMQRAS